MSLLKRRVKRCQLGIAHCLSNAARGLCMHVSYKVWRWKHRWGDYEEHFCVFRFLSKYTLW